MPTRKTRPHACADSTQPRRQTMNTYAHCAHVTAYWQARIAAYRREQEQIERDSL